VLQAADQIDDVLGASGGTRAGQRRVSRQRGIGVLEPFEGVPSVAVEARQRAVEVVQVYVFKDRIEIVSPGGLPAGMSEADLGVKSMPRNPLLFGMLYRMDVVENIGSGIRRIRDLCREHGVAEPAIDTSEH